MSQDQSTISSESLSFSPSSSIYTIRAQDSANLLRNASYNSLEDVSVKVELNDDNQSHTKPNISFIRLALVTLCFAGVQFGWALQISLLTPFLLELGIPKALITIVWLCGPVAGLIVQPTVGAFSDQCTSRWGRRRPFILFGAIFVAVSLLLIPNALDIGRLFGDTRTYHPAAIGLTVAGFWMLDIANNMLQGPCRALVADIAPPEKQETGNALFTFWLGLGNILGFITGWMPWSSWITFTGTKMCGTACQDLRISFSISIVVLTATVIVTLIAAKEKPFTRTLVQNNDEESPASRDRPLLHLFRVLFHLPKPMIRVCLVQFFNWFAWFTFLIYITVWVALDVFHGSPDENDPTYHLFENGVRYGSFGLAGFAGCSLLFSPFVPRLSSALGTRVIFFIGQFILATCLGLTFFIRDKYFAVALISVFGIPWSITNTIPFAITANVAQENEKGVYMGILNIFVVIPQLIMSGVGPLISHFSRGSVTATLATGGASALISCIFVIFLIVPPNEHAKKQRESRIESPAAQAEDEYHPGVSVSYTIPSTD